MFHQFSILFCGETPMGMGWFWVYGFTGTIESWVLTISILSRALS